MQPNYSRIPKPLWVILLLTALVLGSCRYNNQSFRKFNQYDSPSKKHAKIKVNKVIYSGLYGEMPSEETGKRTYHHHSTYKDTTIQLLLEALHKDTLFSVTSLTIEEGRLCNAFEYTDLKNALDSLKHHYSGQEPELTLLINHYMHEGIDPPPAQTLFAKHYLTLVFCVLGKDGFTYINGQRIVWQRDLILIIKNKNEQTIVGNPKDLFYPRHVVKGKYVKKAVERSFKAYKKR